MISLDELLNLAKLSDKLVTHETPVGDVAFVAPLTKSFVEAHYRHGKDGQLIFVHGYTNKKYAKPEDLTVNALHKQGEEIHKKAKPLENNEGQKFNSFHFGDEVFVKYSHMHDQHFGVGAVMGIRKDPNHGGLLVQVRLLNGHNEWYAPSSLVHLHKENIESRGHEVSNHKDDAGNTIDYQHLSEDQKVKFYDLYKAWYMLQRMGEMYAFKQHKDEFKVEKTDEHGNTVWVEPTHKSDLTAEQKIKLESYNPYPTIPYEGLIQSVSQPEYDDGKHVAAVKKLLETIEDFKAKGAPTVSFPKLKKPSSKKENAYIPAAWLKGMFPSTVSEDKQSKEDAMADLEKLSMDTFGTTNNPSTKGKNTGNSSDFYYGQSQVNITHGAVIQAEPEGTQYQPAPKLPTKEQQKEIAYNFWDAIAGEVEAPSLDESPSKSPTPTVKVDKAPKKTAAPKASPATEPKLMVPSDEEQDISNLNFKVTGNANNQGFKGAHSKYIAEAGDGHKYLFKPYNSAETHRVWADIIAAKVAKVLGLPTAEVGSKPVTLPVPHGLGGSYQGTNAVGSVQRVIQGHKFSSIAHYVDNDFQNCPQHVLEQLQREHVLDWLIGNNDAHKNQFLVDKDGNIVGVDKGQAFKFYKDDVLSLTWDPGNNIQADHEQVYSVMLKAAKKGKIKLDFGVVNQFIAENVPNLTSLNWWHMVHPYAANSVEWADKPSKLENLATKRLSSLQKDFKKLYESVGIPTEYDASQKKYKKAEAVSQPKEELPESDTYQPDAVHQIDATFHTAVLKSGIHGKSMMAGGGDVEDMNMLFTHYEWDPAHKPKDYTGKGLEVSFKVLAGSDAKVAKFFDTVEDQTVTYHSYNSTLPKGHDPLGPIMMLAAKTVNHHAPNGGKAPDGVYNESKIKPFAQWMQNSDKLDPEKPLLSPEQLALKLKKGYITEAYYEDPFSVALEVAKHYHKMGTEMMEAIKNKTKTENKNYAAWSGPFKSKKTTVSDAKHPWATYPHYFVGEDGKLLRKKGMKHAYHQDYQSDMGCMFVKHLDGNIDVRYYPHYSKDLHGQNNLRSQQGNFVIDIQNWDGNIDAMHKARKIMKDFGLDHRLSTHTDIECMYLTRIAWHNAGNVKFPSEWKKLSAMENDKKKVEALQDFCAKVYGGKKPNELKKYNPMPRWDKNGGSHYFLNPYVMEHLATKPNKVRIATHNLTAGTDEKLLKNIVENGLICTELRRRYDWPVYGMSVSADQNSGGASYVYTHSTTTPTDKSLLSSLGGGSLAFRPELFARTDCFSYAHDNYGSTNFGWDNHHSMDTRVPIMDVVKSDKHIHETMFKNRIPLDEWFIGCKGTKTYGAGWAKTLKKMVSDMKPEILKHASFDES
jgi:hypothetical protein